MEGGRSRISGSIAIGAVTYLNSRPLVDALPRLAPHARVVMDVPSRLAQGLAAGEFDVALIPSIEYLRHPGYTVVSDACVACDGPVRSVKLYGRRPVEEIRTLALDEGSRTSAALVQILLAELFHVRPQLLPLPIGAAWEDSPADAVLVIGDRGMLTPATSWEFTWDLGQQWSRWTGLPFVFALWVGRDKATKSQLSRALAAARDEGESRLEEIACQAASQVGLPQSECLTYLRDNLEFHLGPRQRQGLARFYELAQHYGLAPAGVELVFDHGTAG